MMIRIHRLILIIGFAAVLSTRAKSDQPACGDQPDAERIDKLIQQLGSARFSEREAASKQIKEIGEPALTPLVEAANRAKDLETKRRVELLADQIELTVLENLFKEGLRLQQQKDHKKAIGLFEQAIKKGIKRYHPDQQKAPAGDILFLSDAHLELARVLKALRDFERAANAFHMAVYYANNNGAKRRLIDAEWFGMVAQLVSDWKGDVTEQTDKDPARKALLAKYPLVLLHSRRYAGGRYLQSAYSFLYETTDAAKHFNDVQLLFDNGRRDHTFSINMLGGQENRIVDLGAVDFEKDVDPMTIKNTAWRSDDRTNPIEGHVFLEHVKDERGNNFFTLFQIVAVDKDSKYVAFVWRRLPGGKIVKRQ